MDANSRRSWAPLETVELPDDPELQVYFPEEKVVSVDAFLDVLVMIRDSGKRRLVVQGITRETALLFLRVYPQSDERRGTCSDAPEGTQQAQRACRALGRRP